MTTVLRIEPISFRQNMQNESDYQFATLDFWAFCKVRKLEKIIKNIFPNLRGKILSFQQKKTLNASGTTRVDEYMHQISCQFVEKQLRFDNFNVKKTTLRYLQGFGIFPICQCLPIWAASKTIWPSFFAFLTTNYLKTCMTLSKPYILSLTFWDFVNLDEFDLTGHQGLWNVLRSIPETIHAVSSLFCS